MRDGLGWRTNVDDYMVALDPGMAGVGALRTYSLQNEMEPIRAETGAKQQSAGPTRWRGSPA